jgi:hypothetical protein
MWNSSMFNLVACKYVHAALEEVPRMIQLWACKQVMRIAATNGLPEKWTEGLNEKCRSCCLQKETCAHILYCDKVGCVDVLMQTIELLEGWFMDSETDPGLA